MVSAAWFLILNRKKILGFCRWQGPQGKKKRRPVMVRNGLHVQEILKVEAVQGSICLNVRYQSKSSFY